MDCFREGGEAENLQTGIEERTPFELLFGKRYLRE